MQPGLKATPVVLLFTSTTLLQTKENMTRKIHMCWGQRKWLVHSEACKKKRSEKTRWNDRPNVGFYKGYKDTVWATHISLWFICQDVRVVFLIKGKKSTLLSDRKADKALKKTSFEQQGCLCCLRKQPRTEGREAVRAHTLSCCGTYVSIWRRN